MTNPLQILNALHAALFGRKDDSQAEPIYAEVDVLPDGYPLQPPRDEQKWRRAYSRLS